MYYKSVSAIAGGGKTAVLLNTFSKGLARCSGSNWVFFPDPNWLCAPGANSGKLWKNSDNLVFTDEMGAHLAIHTFYKYFKKIAASIGRPDARVHDLRHTAATVMIASGADIKSVQDFMGHATASFTLNVYAHTSEQMMKDTAARTQSYYEKLKKA